MCVCVNVCVSVCWTNRGLNSFKSIVHYPYFWAQQATARYLMEQHLVLIILMLLLVIIDIDAVVCKGKRSISSCLPKSKDYCCIINF